MANAQKRLEIALLIVAAEIRLQRTGESSIGEKVVRDAFAGMTRDWLARQDEMRQAKKKKAGRRAKSDTR